MKTAFDIISDLGQLGKSVMGDLSATAPSTPSPAPTEGRWDLASFLENGSPVMGGLLILLGIVTLMWGAVIMIKKLMGGGYTQDSWMKIIMLLLIGGAIMTGGMSIARAAGAKGPDMDKDPAPITPPAEPSAPTDPITLPKVENLESLWLLPLLLIVIFGLYMAIRKIGNDRKNDQHKAAQKALEDAEKKRLDDARIAEELRIETLIATRWQAVLDEHSLLKAKFLKSETDWDLLFKYPALQDVSVPQTAAMVRAMAAAENTDSTRPTGLSETSDISGLAYPRAVDAFSIAWRIATEHAQRVGQKNIPREERKKIKLVRTLLNIADDAGSSETERENAYRQIQRLLKEIPSITVPKQAFKAIEERRQLELTAEPATRSSAIAL